MKVEVVMPRLSDSMSEGSVTAWFRGRIRIGSGCEPVVK